MAFTVKYDGNFLTDHMRIIDVHRNLGAGINSTTEENVFSGADFVRSRRDKSTIEVEFRTFDNIVTARRILAKLTSSPIPTELIFSDEPNLFYQAIRQGEITLTESKSKLFATGTITFLIPAGEAESVDTKVYIGKAVLVLDFEAGTINAWGNVGARQFLNRVKEKTGVYPMIYMSAEVTRQFNWSIISSTNPLWVAQYASTSPTGYQSKPWTDGKGYGAWSSAAIHQYSSSGTLMNWNGQLDLNLAYIDANQWKQLAGGNSTEQNSNNSNSELEDDDLMKFTYKIIDAKTNKSQGTVYYYDGNKIVALSNEDQLKIIRQIYKDTTGKDLKQYTWRTDAPWYVRFMQAINQKTVEVAWK